MQSIYNLTRNKLQEYILSINEKKYRSEQIFDWLYKKRVRSFNDMSNLNINIIDNLNKDYAIDDIKIVKKEIANDVIKYLFELEDKNKIEAVIMFHNYGNSLCISTQVGCNMGCVFCESGKRKKDRNLTTSEMVLQILKVEQDSNIRISHVVLMGIGEPFDNFDNVMDFINIINDQKGIEIGIRHITISTCGIVPKIKDLINENIQVNLAISLHAPNNKLRNELMPINKIYDIDLLIKTVKEYVDETNRKVTFEYILIDNLNDSIENALELSKLIKGINCYVNLIPYNETSDDKYKRSKNIDKFMNILKQNKINVRLRREFGSNISAACGQLRSTN
ncbi:MAG: 23S rRNA (adenine(2503)-C(2))-methyltransferase RlmN [Bacilli bacterium]|nr:23S rRNA (adenine(2503)-C(2))-methyltransferase RlmN [Bacilli bacterium]